jgi:hypothetical protein
VYQREPLSRFANIIAATLSILLVGSFVILAFCYVRPFYQLSAAQLRDAGLELKKLTPPGALIVAADMAIRHFLSCQVQGLALSAE